ncbi:hypothetical protein Gbfr_021_248 [Gluconobacter frateurii M-2]|nr:hypothetical protein Gbfr_021_248 [Gluconobacter frateurii M-2]
MDALVAPSVHEFINSTGMAFKVRAVSVQGNEWFVAKDVCDAIGLTTNPSAHIGHLGHMEKITLKPDYGGLDFSSMFPKGRGPRMMLIISEAGLYKLIMRSDKPDARPFQDWVTKVVLPTIRKEGVYVRGEEKIETAESVDELEALQEQMLALAARKASILEERLKAAEAKVVEMQPKASAYDLIFDQDGLVRLSEVQKAIRVRDTRINLNAMTPDLIRMGWLYRQNGTPNGPPRGHDAVPGSVPIRGLNPTLFCCSIQTSGVDILRLTGPILGTNAKPKRNKQETEEYSQKLRIFGYNTHLRRNCPKQAKKERPMTGVCIRPNL